MPLPGRGSGQQDAPLKPARSYKGIPWDVVADIYVRSAVSLKELAQHLGASSDALEYHSAREGWVARREAFRREQLKMLRDEHEEKRRSQQQRMLERADVVQERGLDTGAAVLGLKQQQIGALVRRLRDAPDQVAKDAILAEVPDVLDAFRALRTAQEARIWGAETEGKPSARTRQDVVTLSIDDLLGPIEASTQVALPEEDG